ncbi:hypothetical protein KIPB_017229, partial [Kipferlia bialata]
PPSDAFSCAICHDTFKKPVMLRECKHIFCSLCINRVLSDEQINTGCTAECPRCRKQFTRSQIIYSSDI